MNRLTKIIDGYAHGAEGGSKDKLTGDYCRGEFEATACVEKLAEYEDLEEQGRLLKLPCEIGHTVYMIYQLCEGAALEIEEHKIRLEDLENIGKTVFLTHQEAEDKLAEMEGKNGD